MLRRGPDRPRCDSDVPTLVVHMVADTAVTVSEAPVPAAAADTPSEVMLTHGGVNAETPRRVRRENARQYGVRARQAHEAG